MKSSIASILASVEKAKTQQEKIDILQKNDSPTLRMILQWALHPDVVWLLPPGTPPYKAVEEDTDVEGRIYSETRRLYLFVQGGGREDLTPLKREQLFIQVLESIAADDAKLLCSVKDKKIPYKGITPKLINKAFPDLPL